MFRTGLAPAGDDEGVRWVAVRHADDHIHIVATLARQDGKRKWPRNDFHRVREACHAAEERLGLRTTARGDRTAGIRPGRPESEKATRLGAREPARTTLSRKVRIAAARSESLDEFFFSLRQDGVLVRPRMSTRDTGQVTGYAVATLGMTDRAGAPIFYGGGKLAADLSLPQLLRRWDVTPAAEHAAPRTATAPNAERGQQARETRGRTFLRGEDTAAGGPFRLGAVDRRRLYEQAGAAASAAAEHMSAAADSPTPGAGADAAWASADHVASAARLIEGRRGGPLTEAARAFERAGREAWGRVPEPSAAGHGVRTGTRLLGLINTVLPGESRRVLALMAQLAALADTLTRLREAQGRADQAAAARAAATAINADLMSRSVAAGPPGEQGRDAARDTGRASAATPTRAPRTTYGPPVHTWDAPRKAPGGRQDRPNQQR